jgi:pantothenate kinase type III
LNQWLNGAGHIGKMINPGLQQELEAMFNRQNQSADAGATSIPAPFLRVTVVC